MENKALAVGVIVTILHPDKYNGMQGQVSAFQDDGNEDGPWLVVFGEPYRSFFGADYSSIENRTIRFADEDLQVDTEWLPRHWVVILFGREGPMWGRTWNEAGVLDVTQFCMIAGCTAQASRKALCNLNGTIYFLHVCEDHGKKWHGRYAEEGLYLRDVL